jgi:hypothetical protein
VGLLSGITDTLGLTDSAAAERAADKSIGMGREQMERLDAIELLTDEDLAVALKSPEVVALLEAQGIDPSELGNITEDSALRENQLAALQGLRDQSEQGLTSQDKYQMDQLLGDVSANERASQAQIEDQMARRGMQSSGAALMAQQQNKQSGSNQARQKAMQMAAQAQQNTIGALSQLGMTSTQMANQDFNRKATIASAKDAISKSNAMNRQNVDAQNIASRQNIANQGVNIANQQQMYNAGAKQQVLDNKFKQAGAQNAVSQNMANNYMGQAQAQQQADAATMGAIASVGAAAAGAPSDARVKMNVEEGGSSIKDMLDKLTAHKYDYKEGIIEDPSMEKPQLGVMAQDLEQSEMGSQMVEEDENGVKRVDYANNASTMMAALAELNERLNKLEGN